MRKILQRCILLLIIFAAAFFIFSGLSDQEEELVGEEMTAATLPVIYTDAGGKLVNKLHGYAQEMSAASVRDTIWAVDTDGVLPIRIDIKAARPDVLSFQLRSLDGERLIQDGEVSLQSESESLLSCDLEISNLLDEGEEYLLIIDLDLSGSLFHYYTRIVENGEYRPEEYISFARDFHEMTLDESRRDELLSYADEGDTDEISLCSVSLEDGAYAIGWGDLDPEDAGDVSVSLKELDKSGATVTLNSLILAKNDEGETVYIRAEECCRLERSGGEISLLDYRRSAEEIFRGEASRANGDTLNLGIRGEEIEYMANASGTAFFFAQSGELWGIDTKEGSAGQVFGFCQPEHTQSEGDAVCREYDIRILGSKGRDVDFAVLGYMYRGAHEGNAGISVCHYDGDSHTVDERLFLSSQNSYQFLKEEVGRAMYLSDDDTFYIAIGNRLECFDLEGGEESVMVDDFGGADVIVSNEGEYMLWSQREDDGASVLWMADLVTGSVRELTRRDGEDLIPLAFMGDDCIYGIAEREGAAGGDTETGDGGDTELGDDGVTEIEDDSVTEIGDDGSTESKDEGGTEAESVTGASDVGSGTSVMYQIVIADISGGGYDVLKTYEQEGIYVRGIEISDDSIYLNRVIKDGERYEETAQDVIVSSDMRTDEAVTVSERISDSGEREVILNLSGKMSKEVMETYVSSWIPASDGDIYFAVSDDAFSHEYYVYVMGSLVGAYDNVSEAIRAADKNGGNVIGALEECVWRETDTNGTLRLEISGAVGESDEAMALSAMIRAAGEADEGAQTDDDPGGTGGGSNAPDPDFLLESGMSEYEVLTQCIPQRRVYDLTGCTLYETFYFVKRGIPVYTCDSDDAPKLVCGYEGSYVWIYDPDSMSIYSMVITTAAAEFKKGGSVFYAVGEVKCYTKSGH